MMKPLLLLSNTWPWMSMMALLHLRSMCAWLRRHLLKLFMIELMLKERLKGGRALGIISSRSMSKSQSKFPLMTLAMSSFAKLKRKKLPNKRGRRSKRRKKQEKHKMHKLKRSASSEGEIFLKSLNSCFSIINILFMQYAFD